MQQSLLIRYQFAAENAGKEWQLHALLKEHAGAAVDFVAAGTVMVESRLKGADFYAILLPLFTFEDKLFVAELGNFYSQHAISRTGSRFRPAI